MIERQPPGIFLGAYVIIPFLSISLLNQTITPQKTTFL
nr:MAG TPA: hypothetical protein [Bacteriophage sp.]